MNSTPMNLLGWLKTTRWRSKLQSKTDDAPLTARLMKLGVVADRVHRTDTGLGVTIPGINFLLRVPDELFMLESPGEVEAVLAAGGEFSRAWDEALHVKIDGLKFAPTNAEEILIIREIYAEGVYNYRPTRPTVVWDIGGNVGMASLFFSRLPNVEHVHAFEPLADNRQRAEHHYALNSGPAARITQHPHGLGREAGSIEATFAPSQRGSFSISRDPQTIDRLKDSKLDDAKRETITLVAAAQVLEQLAAAHPHREILVKMDCEGAEEEILPALIASGALRRIQTFLIETHHGYGPGLAGLLHEAGFDVLLHHPHSRDLGYLFAFNRKGTTD